MKKIIFITAIFFGLAVILPSDLFAQNRCCHQDKSDYDKAPQTSVQSTANASTATD